MKLIENFLKKQKVKKYEDTILDVEKLAGISKLPLTSLFMGIYERTNDKTFKEIADKISEGRDKLSVYKPYLSSEVYLILNESEKRNLPIYKIIDNIDTVRNVVKKVKSKIYSSLNFAIGYFVLISLVVYFLLKRMSNTFGNIDMVKNKGLINFTMNTYPFVIVALFAGIILAFYVFKYKTPVIRKIFIDMELTLILTLTKMMYSANLPIKSTIEYFASSKNYFSDSFKALRVSDREESLIKAYIQAIKQELEPKESSVLELSFKAGRFREILMIIADRRINTVQLKAEKYSKIIFYFIIFISIIPISFLLVAYIDVIMQITKNALEMMNKR